MEFSKSGYISQLVTYFKNKDYESAFSFSKDFREHYPDEIIAYFFVAASAYWSKRYEIAAVEGRRAFNKASDIDDMLKCAVITASAYYELGRFDDAFKLLHEIEKSKTNENVEKLLFVLSMKKNDGSEAAEHLSELYRMNHEAAVEIAKKYL